MTDICTLKDALDIYQTQYTQTDHLWNYFGTVTLAILGFSIGSSNAKKSLLEAGVIILGYWVFCIGNFMALKLAQTQLIQLSKLVNSKNADGFTIQMKPLDTDLLGYFYWAVVIAVTIGIILITIKQTNNKKTLSWKI